jgi:hypothetical protein
MPATSSVLPVREELLEVEDTAMIMQMQKSGHLVNHFVAQHLERSRQAQQFF